MKQKPQQVVHPLQPIFDENSRVLILGTMPSPVSRQQAFYYGHPQNRFWRVLGQILDEPLPSDPSGKQALLLHRHIALWDVLASCTIQGAQDATIRQPVVNDFHLLFAKAPIQKVFTTGQKAKALFVRYCSSYGFEPVALPSPSPANCAVSFEALCESWRQILPWLEEERL